MGNLAIVTVGPHYSGFIDKSRPLAAENRFARICVDEINHSLCGDIDSDAFWTLRPMAWKLYRVAIEEAVENSFDVVIVGSHVSDSERAKAVGPLEEAEFRIEYRHYTASWEVIADRAHRASLDPSQRTLSLRAVEANFEKYQKLVEENVL